MKSERLNVQMSIVQTTYSNRTLTHNLGSKGPRTPRTLSIKVTHIHTFLPFSSNLGPEKVKYVVYMLDFWPGVVVHIYNPSTQEVKAVGSRVQGHPGPHHETLSQTKKMHHF
jgi:hypothetical protein